MTKATETRKELAKDINFEGTAHRIMRVKYYDLDEYLEDHKEGTIHDLGMCWSNGGDEEFTPMDEGGFIVYIECENAKGHKIDYDNTPIETLEEIGAEGCEEEEEVILDAKFEITACTYCEDSRAVWMEVKQL